METHSDSQVVKIMLKLITRNSAEDLYIHRYPSLVIGCMCACVVLQRGEISSPKQAKKKGCQEVSRCSLPLLKRNCPICVCKLRDGLVLAKFKVMEALMRCMLVESSRSFGFVYPLFS